MNIDAIYSAQSWNNVQKTTNTANTTTEVPSVTDTPAAGGGNSEGEEKTTTKITTNAEGDTIMLFMQGDKVIKTIKLGNTGQTPTNNDQQQYVDNGSIDIGSMLNSGV